MGYPKEIVTQAHRALARRREEAERDREERRQRVLNALPEIAELESELSTTSLRLARAVLSGTDVERKVAEIRAFNEGIQAKIARLLTSHGFSADELKARRHCPVCSDAGYVDGKPCACLERELKNRMYERLGAVSELKNAGFDAFSLALYPTEAKSGPSPARVMERTFAECKKYAAEFSAASPSLLLTGGTGLGKTHLSLAIASAAVEKGADVVYVPFHVLIGRLETARFSRGGGEYRDLLDAALGCGLLILDDVGSEFGTAFSSAVLYDLVNTRHFSSLPTIISTNLDLRELQQRYTERVASRLVGWYKILPFVGEDIRLKLSYPEP